MSTGIRPSDKAVVAFEKLLDPREPAERWEPDLEAIIDERLERSGC